MLHPRIALASVVLAAAIYTGCLSDDCEAERHGPRAIVEQSLDFDAPLAIGTNAVRLTCLVRLDVPADADVLATFGWSTALFMNDQGLDVAGRLTIADTEAVLTSTTRDDGTGPVLIGVGDSIRSSPCGNTCEIPVEFVVRTTPTGDLSATTVPAAFHLALTIEHAALDASAAVGDIACDPVEHLTIP